MPYLPMIRDYKPFLVQRSGGDTPFDVAESWGLIVKHNPYPLFPEAKERYSVDWKDEDGTDEYGITQFLDNLDFEVEFWIADPYDAGDNIGGTSRERIRFEIESFLSFLKHSEYIDTYDAYTGIGFSRVRMVSFSEEEYISRLGKTDYFFKVGFRCDAPTSRCVYDEEQGKIVAYSAPESLPSPWLPLVSNYQPFYFATTRNSAAIDTQTMGLIVKADVPPMMPDAKDDYKEDNPLANGLSSPGITTPPHYKAMEFTLSFYIGAEDVILSGRMFSAAELVYSRALEFRNLLTQNRLLAYDSFTNVGFYDVQYVDGSVETFIARDNWARLIFSVQLRANNPLKSVVYRNGQLVIVTDVGLNDEDSIALYSSDGFRLTAL